MEIRKIIILKTDYLSTLEKSYVCDIIIPIAFCVLSFILLEKGMFKYDKQIIGDVITLFGIISGFGITSIALLLTSKNPSIDEYKQTKTNIVIDGVEISYFRKLYILISYTTIMSFLGIFLFFIGSLIVWNLFVDGFINLLKSLSIGYITHVLIVNIRSVSSIYFLYIRETNLNK